MPDLLPDDFGTETVTPPVAILREQSEHLTKRTSGLVFAKVVTQKSDLRFLQRFILEVPSLDDYAYELFVVIHEITLYPLQLSHTFTGRTVTVSARNPEEFEDSLRQFFALPEVRRIVAALKAQALPAAAPA